MSIGKGRMIRMYNLLMMMYCEWIGIKMDRGHAFLVWWVCSEDNPTGSFSQGIYTI
jgi:hypothetical protein